MEAAAVQFPSSLPEQSHVWHRYLEATVVRSAAFVWMEAAVDLHAALQIIEGDRHTTCRLAVIARRRS